MACRILPRETDLAETAQQQQRIWSHIADLAEDVQASGDDLASLRKGDPEHSSADAGEHNGVPRNASRAVSGALR